MDPVPTPPTLSETLPSQAIALVMKLGVSPPSASSTAPAAPSPRGFSDFWNDLKQESAKLRERINKYGDTSAKAHFTQEKERSRRGRSRKSR